MRLLALELKDGNVGLVIGGKSRLVALDIDGQQGFASLAKLALDGKTTILPSVDDHYA